MKKRAKTLISLGLVVGLLAGCGNTNVSSPQESSSKTTESSSATESSVVVESEEESKYPEYLNLDGFRPIVKEGEEITLNMTMTHKTQQTNEPEERWFYQFIEQELNIDLEMDQNYTAERKSVFLNSGDLPDMMWDALISTTDLVVYGQEGGLFLDISAYINEELTPNIVAAMEKYPDAFEACVTPDGKMYTVPVVNESKTPGGTQRMFVDTAYMEAAGITELPTTLDEFTDMLRAFKKVDPAIMGVDEVYPWIINWHYDWYYLMSAWGWVTDDYGALAKPTWDETEQKIVIPCLQDKFKDYVKYIYTLYQEDLLHDDYFPMSSQTVRALSAEGKVALLSDSTVTASQPDRGDEFIALSPVTSDWTDKPISGQFNTGYTLGGVVISADTEYPELCVRLLDYLYSEEGATYAYYGPVSGSEDELGMITGVVKKDDTVVSKAVADGLFGTNSDYTLPYVILSDSMCLNLSDANEFNYKRVGFSGTQTAEERMAIHNSRKPGEEGYSQWSTWASQYPYLVKPMNQPYATVEQAERLTDLMSVMENYVDAEMAKFVVGERPIEELDAFMTELWALDGQELWDLGEELYKR